jgi:hypothetical protein
MLAEVLSVMLNSNCQQKVREHLLATFLQAGCHLCLEAGRADRLYGCRMAAVVLHAQMLMASSTPVTLLA